VKALLAVAAAFVLVPSAFGSAETRSDRAVAAPQGLHAFLLSPTETRQQYYPRTPSFAWQPAARPGGTYDFELATSPTFDDSTILFTYTKLRIPALAVAHQLPWMTGSPYALWAHVRWESADGHTVTPWGTPFGFNVRWSNDDYPQQLPAPEGLIRWKPIAGATRYQVLYPDITGSTAFETTTNVADEREFFTFHNPLGYSTIHWRVRAVRYIDDKDLLKNGLPRVSYGPWSATFSTTNPAQATGALTPTDTVSDTWDKAGHKPQAHDLTPGFAWTPSSPIVDPYIGFVGSSLYRVYIATDDQCVNVVYKSPVVGSPAYAPRTTGGPFALPQDSLTVARWDAPPYLQQFGTEGRSVDATGVTVQSNEVPGSSLSSGNGGGGTAPASTGGSDGGQASVDLWDSGWPTGRYYWTVVPVEAQLFGLFDPKATTLPIEYHDMAVPQDSCQAGVGMSFGKTSQPVVTAASGTPWVSGLAPDGRVVASAAKVPTVQHTPLVAWEPAVGATTYEVQLSRKSYPWSVAWSTITPATSLVLPIGKNDAGTWFYRVRGIDPALPAGAQAMTWSTPVRLHITGDSFKIVK
jgi:hypothetical protein